MSKRFLVCIDSDGCAFDTMEIKTLGINKQKIRLNGVKNDVEYDGMCDVEYLYIPSFGEIFYLITSFVRI